MTPLEQLRTALEEIGKGIDLIDCSGPAANQNIAAITKIILPELKRALAALARMEQPMSDPAIIEVAERALNPYFGPPATETRLLEVHAAAKAFLTAVTPLIEANALETAAKIVETKQFSHHSGIPYIAAAIRALKEQPTSM